MKLEEMEWSPETANELNSLIMERIENFGIQLKAKHPPIAILLGEIAVVEAKLDALMHMLQDKNNVTYETFDARLKQVCTDGIAVAKQTRAIMTAPQGPRIIKP